MEGELKEELGKRYPEGCRVDVLVLDRSADPPMVRIRRQVSLDLPAPSRSYWVPLKYVRILPHKSEKMSGKGTR